MKTFKVLSALLSYPTAELQAAAPELAAVLQDEGLIKPQDLAPLRLLVAQIAERDLLDLQERYVLLFDRSRSLSLHLFEHVHGESRDRGQAMVDLRNLYLAHGLDLDAMELPDYIPMFLEFLAQLPVDEARNHLREPLHILTALRTRLAKRESPYAAVLGALEAIAGMRPDRKAVDEILAEAEDDPNDGKALDRIWEEEQVRFGPEFGGAGDGCPKVGEMLARMDPPAPARDGDIQS